MDFLFGDGAIWFSVPAIGGTLFLVLQMVLGQVGGDLDGDLNADADFDGGVGDGDTPGAEFRLLSVQSVCAFAMGGGWMGLAAMRALDWSFGAATVVAMASGAGVAWMMVALLRQFLKVQSSGNIKLADAVGSGGTVYVQIPPAGQGTGRVNVAVNNRRREYNAVQTGKAFIASNANVRVTGVDRSAGALIVEPA